MKPAKHNFTVWENTTHDEPLVLKDKNKNLINLAGFTARMQIRDSIDSETVNHTLTTEDDPTLGDALVLDPELAKITIHFLTVQANHGGYYDLLLLDAGNKPHMLIEKSKIKFIPAVTDLAG